MGRDVQLGEFEELVLLAILRLGDDAYGVRIREEVEDAGRSTSTGAIYATTDRLEQKGFISSRLGEITAERGGRAKRYFRVEGAGIAALNAAEAARRHLKTPRVAQPIGGVA